MSTASKPWKPRPIVSRNLGGRLSVFCDICGKRRGGGNKIDHSKCAKKRQMRNAQ